MGNSAPRRPTDAAGKVILSNGAVFMYNQPLTVAELMLEHPQEVVVELQLVLNGEKPSALPADHKLEPKKLYVMLPIKKGKPAQLSSVEARDFLAKTRSGSGFVRHCCARIRHGKQESENFPVDRREEEREDTNSDHNFTEILEGRPEFLSGQVSGKGWKPSLDTIREVTVVVEAKVPHWLF